MNKIITKSIDYSTESESHSTISLNKMRKKLTPITGKTSSKTLGGIKKIKPKKSRELINRFHVLLKAQKQLLEKFNNVYYLALQRKQQQQQQQQLTPENYTAVLAENHQQVYKSYKKLRSELSAQSKKEHLKFNQTKIFNSITQLSLSSASSSTHALSSSPPKQFGAQFAELLAEVDAEIEFQGGLQLYQAASLNGQHSKRGSDSSKKLIEWLDMYEVEGRMPSLSFSSSSGTSSSAVFAPPSRKQKQLKALEVGSLSSKNKISTAKWFKDNVTRIDLNSQEPGLIEAQDFMKRPIPTTDADRFDLISLSLVLNFVSSAKERGDMLRRLSYFFKNVNDSNNSSSNNDSRNSKKSANKVIANDDNDDGKTIFPCLFFVLPLPCVTNSKYINKQNLIQLMHQLGYELLQYHESTKLVYMLLKYHGTPSLGQKVKFQKKELANLTRKAQRNNFSIILN